MPAVHFMSLDISLEVAFMATALSFAVTGTSLGFYIRFLWWGLWRGKLLSPLAFCPYCNAWWSGLVVSILGGLPWTCWIQGAFTSCLVAAVVQAQWGLAASDEDEIEKIWKREDNGKTVKS